MEICQTVSNLPEGYYQLECKAMTEHFCISDQHGYLKSGETEATTPVISKGYFDIPVENHWETLTSTPLYVKPNGSLTIGFASSKQGAETGKWHTFGDANGTSDNREGWWCATDFVLLYHAIDDPTGITPVHNSSFADGWYTLDGRRLYRTGRLLKGIYIKVENGKASLHSY